MTDGGTQASWSCWGGPRPPVSRGQWRLQSGSLDLRSRFIPVSLWTSGLSQRCSCTSCGVLSPCLDPGRLGFMVLHLAHCLVASWCLCVLRQVIAASVHPLVLSQSTWEGSFMGVCLAQGSGGWGEPERDFGTQWEPLCCLLSGWGAPCGGAEHLCPLLPLLLLTNPSQGPIFVTLSNSSHLSESLPAP